MAISYFKSSQVHVFPCAYRGTGATSAIDPEARLNTEKNLTHTGNNLKGTYLIERKQSTNIDLLRVVVGGYYFEIDLTVTGGKGWSDLKNNYLAIKTIETLIVSGGKNTRLLARYEGSATGGEYLDVNDEFKGLAIVDSSSIPQNATAYIKVADSNGNILNDAYLPDISSSTGSKSLASDTCIASGDHAVAVGKYNVNAANNLFVVGNGTGAQRSNAFTVNTDGDAAVTRNTTIGGTLSVTGATTSTGNFTVGNNKFTVTANDGNTTVGGTIEVTGASTFTGAATFSNGAQVNGDVVIDGNVECESLEAAQEVNCVDLTVNRISSGNANISLEKTILPSSSVNLGGSSNLFNNVYSKGLYLIDASANAFTISYSSGWNINIDTTTNFLASGNLTIGRSSGAEAAFTESDVTFNKKIIADRGLQVNGVTSSDVLQSNVDVKIASGKHLDLSGNNSGSIKLKGETTTGTSCAVTGNGIYNITFKSNLESAPNGTYSVTMALVIPNPSSLLDSTIYSSEVYRNGQYGWQIKAVHGTYGWTLTFTSGGNPASCNWLVTKIADVA